MSTDSKKTQATRLAELARDSADLFRTAEGSLYASYEINGHQETRSLGSTAFRRWLSKVFYDATKTTPTGQAIKDAISVLEGIASYEGKETPVYLRKAYQLNQIHFDLGDAEWRVVEVTPEGWDVLPMARVRFRRAEGLLALPVPTKGGSIDEMRAFVNVETEDDWRLIVAWVLAALGPHRSYPVLQLLGEQGSAKSSTAQVLRRIIDPNKAPLRLAPKDNRDLMIAANNGLVVVFDNLSGLPKSLSDALCCLSTGGGFGVRANYTDDEEVLFQAMRPAILTGIGDIATASDLLDRAISLNLPVIAPDTRRSEEELWSEFEEALPRILGAFLDVISDGLRNLPATKPPEAPRMADFCRWVTACEPALGWDPGSFFTVYQRNRRDADGVALDASAIGPFLRQAAEALDGWTGTVGKLLQVLNTFADENTKRRSDWPDTARALTVDLQRLAPNLRAEGVQIQLLNKSNKGRMVRLALLSAA